MSFSPDLEQGLWANSVVLNMPPHFDDLESGRLLYSSGSIHANKVPFINQKFTNDAIVPQSPWYNCNIRFYSEQITQTFQAGVGNTISLKLLPMPIFDNLLQSGLPNCIDSADFETLSSDPKFLDAYTTFLKYVATWLSPTEQVPTWALSYNAGDLALRKLNVSLLESGLSIDIPNRYCTSFSREKYCYVGLHVDCWDDLPISERHLSRSRLVVNLGNGDRWFLFIPYNLQSIRLFCGNTPFSAQEVAKWFLNKFPETPVYRLKIRPGEAYIAPTDNIIHDGSTEGGDDYDVFFSALGRFLV